MALRRYDSSPRGEIQAETDNITPTAHAAESLAGEGEHAVRRSGGGDGVVDAILLGGSRGGRFGSDGGSNRCGVSLKNLPISRVLAAARTSVVA